MKEDPQFATVARSDLIRLVTELRLSLEREHQRTAALQRVIDHQREQSRVAWQLAAAR